MPKLNFHHRLPLLLSALCLMPALLWAQAADKDLLAGVKQDVRRNYSDVQHITIDEYLADHPDSVLIDVRAPKEYAVSRIPGALHAPDKTSLEALAKQHAGKELVLYCSVGVRSSRAARHLQEAGFDNVVNLEGSIFEWANDGRQMEDDAGDTQRVHPYNVIWGWRYLSKEARSH